MFEKADALVVFGATGDLARKKIFPSLQAMVKEGRLEVPVVAVGREPLDVEQLREGARESVEEHGGGADSAAFPALARLLRYVGGDYARGETFEALRKALSPSQRPCQYGSIARKAVTWSRWLWTTSRMAPASSPVRGYEPGSWGPPEAGALPAAHGGAASCGWSPAPRRARCSRASSPATARFPRAACGRTRPGCSPTRLPRPVRPRPDRTGHEFARRSRRPLLLAEAAPQPARARNQRPQGSSR